MKETHFANYSLRDLQDLVQESHKDFYGVRGHWAYDADRETLIDWWLSHFTYDAVNNIWRNTTAFVGE